MMAVVVGVGLVEIVSGGGRGDSSGGDGGGSGGGGGDAPHAAITSPSTQETPPPSASQANQPPLRPASHQPAQPPIFASHISQKDVTFASWDGSRVLGLAVPCYLQVFMGNVRVCYMRRAMNT
ncbi:hypothetical protein E2C01_076414 [Portunus trituberculatus]|uniref:Uncharacterized protein n=1 Tax=Portunus trituberculatus TaxID=210409 RepID=A0A5B7IBH5_PORTR|nr:hypothetical protein [Portunus trituberculatus]